MSTVKVRDKYIVMGSTAWVRDVYENHISQLNGEWNFINNKDEFTTEMVKEVNPKYLFFIHWSWRVPDELLNMYECIGFHMTDLPYGRGGSPLQNLILRKHSDTMLSAFRMTSEMDAGPVYMKEKLSLKGSAGDIYMKMSELAGNMIGKIIEQNPIPAPQTGEVVLFKRRKQSQSCIPEAASMDEMYDFIRMLDADGYPAAYVEKHGFRFEFRSAKKSEDGVDAQVRIRKIAEK